MRRLAILLLILLAVPTIAGDWRDAAFRVRGFDPDTGHYTFEPEDPMQIFVKRVGSRHNLVAGRITCSSAVVEKGSDQGRPFYENRLKCGEDTFVVVFWEYTPADP